ncbi:MAG: hypothetical protein V4466_16325 [Pseudomonadota bacterium]
MRSDFMHSLTMIAVALIIARGASDPAVARQADLSQVPCNRLAEALAAYHETTLELDAMTVGYGGAPDPVVAAFGKRMEPVAAFMTTRRLTPRKATAAEPVLFNASGVAMLEEFGRRCVRA